MKNDVISLANFGVSEYIVLITCSLDGFAG